MLASSRPPSLRFARPIARTLAIFALSCASARGDDVDGYRRLETMPRERRAALAENLAEFDRLDARERNSLRRLDRDLARRDPVDQARFRSLIRRYHLWSNGLPDEQRKALRAATTPEARLALVRQIRLKNHSTVEAAGPRLAGVRVGALGLIGPHEMAFLLRVWDKLPDDKRRAVAARRGGKLVEAIRGEAGRMGVDFQRFPPHLARPYESRLEADPSSRALLGPPTRKAEHARKDDNPARATEKVSRRAEHRFAEFLYFEDPAHRPKPVPANHFARFQASCPPWLLAMIDPLSPDDARAYMTALYRQLYPHPAEMPDKAVAPDGSASPKPPTPRPAPISSAESAVPL